MASTFSHSLTILAGLALLGGCSSGGGGGPTPPVIVTAAFVGGGGSPTAGDQLIITVSRASSLVAGTTLDDADFTMSDGTLGTIGGSATALTTNSFQITLGAGVTFTPGTTTIVFSDAQDSIQSTDGALAKGGTPIAITSGDGDAPTISLLTLNRIEGELNGTGAAGGTLQVPRSGFTIDVSHADVSTSVDTNATFISSNVTVSVNGSGRAPGTDLSDGFQLSATASLSNFTVPASVQFPDGAQTLTVIVSDITGMSSSAATFAFRVRNLENNLRPFEAQQLWYLDLSRDIETISTTLALTATANGTPDFEEVLIACGILDNDPIPNVLGSFDSNEVVMGELRTRIVTELGTLFSGVNIAFTFDNFGMSFPAGESSVAFGSAPFSQMCIAGSGTATPSTVLGSALIDYNNTTDEDDCQTAFGPSNTRLGVFPHAAVFLGFASGPASEFRMTYDTFRPAIGGTPIGDDGTDGARLLEVVAGTNVGADARIDAMDAAIQKMARLVAVVTAHECGHSMGLVANDPMPVGLYGNDPVNFPLSGSQPASNADGHIENTTLFPAGAQNVMSPAINFEAAQSTSTTFNTLNLSYLR
ncbi:MAG: hypothetical protein KDB80_06375, partial [Planctomycetes bacterium]|nr:hypothetical protein [Planctomycetota bacterium]